MASNAKRISRGADIISTMPVDILLQILSRMDTKLATVASILSRQWRYLPALPSHFRLTLETKISYQHGSHRPLNQRLVTFLNVFRAFANSQTHPNMRSLVEFDYFNIAHMEYLNQCIIAAISGQLEHFEVLNRGAHYEFPSHCFINEVNNHLQSLAISNCFITSPLGFCIFCSLRKLALFGCSLHNNDSERNDLGQQRFEVLLQSCSSSEILSIEDSTVLPRLIIKAPNELKQLTIHCCKTDGIQIINAPKLENLKCHIKCVHFGSERCTLSVATAPCLKHFQLEFEFYPNCHVRSSYTLEKLSKTAPNLESLILRFENTIRREHYWNDREVPSDFSHDNLKELKIKGYQGGFVEFEIKLILCMLERATRLESVIRSIDTTHTNNWIAKEKRRILERFGGRINSNLIITFR